MRPKNFLHRIHNLKKLTSSEARIADYFSRNYTDLVFDNVSSISEKTGVSKATVVRFISKLGFQKFAEFHQSLRGEVSLTHDSLHIRYSLKQKLFANAEEDIIGYNFANIIRNLESTYTNIPSDHFIDSARIIASCPGSVYITGQRSSYALAYLFHNMIRRLLRHTLLIEPQGADLSEALLDVSPEDVLFTIFRHPYARQTFNVAKYFSDRGARVILLTDSDFSPLSDIATTQLVVNTEGVSIFTSSAAIVAMLECLNIAILKFCDERISERLERAEDLYNRFDVFCDPKR